MRISGSSDKIEYNQEQKARGRKQEGVDKKLRNRRTRRRKEQKICKQRFPISLQ